MYHLQLQRHIMACPNEYFPGSPLLIPVGYQMSPMVIDNFVSIKKKMLFSVIICHPINFLLFFLPLK
jgi:hypothetical protein